jgi:hypothetical protein
MVRTGHRPLTTTTTTLWFCDLFLMQVMVMLGLLVATMVVVEGPHLFQDQLVSAWVMNDIPTTPVSLSRHQHHQLIGQQNINSGQHSKKSTSHLFYMSSSGAEAGIDHEEEDGDSSSDKDTTTSLPIRERLAIVGVSVSPNGFHAILKGSSIPTTTTTKVGDDERDNDPQQDVENLADKERFLPLKVTNDPQDHRAATSAESLTLCQLLSGVDMAGAILPPDMLSKIVVYHLEEKLQDIQDYDDLQVDDDDMGSTTRSEMRRLTPQELKVLDAVQDALPEDQETFKDAPEWLQSRTRLPQVTLDQLTLTHITTSDDDDDDPSSMSTPNWHFRLECNLPELNNLQLVVDDIKSDTLAPLVYNYDRETSLIYTCLALALRYKAPTVLERQQQEYDVSASGKRTNNTSENNNNSVWSSSADLDRFFPQRTTVSKLQQQSTRVIENIERGFEIHKLTGALQIAMRRGDIKAAERIRAKLDEYDSLQDLPTTITSDVDDDIDEDSDDGEGGLDDLENNLFQ